MLAEYDRSIEQAFWPPRSNNLMLIYCTCKCANPPKIVKCAHEIVYQITHKCKFSKLFGGSSVKIAICLVAERGTCQTLETPCPSCATQSYQRSWPEAMQRHEAGLLCLGGGLNTGGGLKWRARCSSLHF